MLWTFLLPLINKTCLNQMQQQNILKRKHLLLQLQALLAKTINIRHSSVIWLELAASYIHLQLPKQKYFTPNATRKFQRLKLLINMQSSTMNMHEGSGNCTSGWRHGNLSLGILQSAFYSLARGAISSATTRVCQSPARAHDITKAK